MNSTYEDVKEILIAIDIPESYMQKALKEKGLNNFPETGLSNEGLSKLIERTIYFANSESELTRAEGENPVQEFKGSTLF